MREFLGLNLGANGKISYIRTPEGIWSWQHILQVSLFMTAMVVLAIIFGVKNKNKSDKEKNKVLIVAAILIDAFELFKIVVICIRHQSPLQIFYTLPLFLCSIQLITIPLAAFCKGRIKEASLDFVLVFGLLGGVFGTVGAANIYNVHPVLSMDPLVSGVTHSLSGFASLYIAISGMVSMKKKNFVITLSILLGFAIMALIANKFTGYNYMFLKYHDGTPYSIFYNLVNGNKVLYPLIVISIFVVYISLFYLIFHSVKDKKALKNKQN